MFSFFRKSRKDPKPEPQAAHPAVEEEERKSTTEGSKKKGKNEKKSSKDKKVSFKVESEPVALSDEDVLISPSSNGSRTDPQHPSVTVPFGGNKVAAFPISVISDSSHETDAIPFQMGNGIFQQDDPPDVFLEAQEAVQTEISYRLPTVSTQPFATDATISKIATEPFLPIDDVKSQFHHDVIASDEQDSVVSNCDVNPRNIQDASCKRPVMAEQREHPEIPSTAPFVSEETATSRDKSNKMTTTEDDQIGMMEEQVRQLESELGEKSQRIEQLEALLADDDRLGQLETLERLEAEWNKERELVDNEREEELRLLQEALEEALEEKAEIEAKMLRDASRESQLLDDFEWKLGEIEREYKKKLTEVEKATEERVKKEMAAENQQLMEDKRDIDEKLAEIAHLKSYEAEVSQLRGLIHEQQRAIRVAARQVDQLRVTERLLQDDLNKIRTQGYTRKQQQEMEEKWEEKTLTECNRLRAELIATNEEEMLKAIRQVVHEKDDQISALKRQFEAQQLALNHQMTELKNSFQQREAKLNKQIEATQAAADRELCEMRRQLNKVQDSHVEAVEQIERKHAEEIERCGTFSSESKEMLDKVYEEKFQSIEIQHQSQLNALQSLIEEEKQEALTQLGEHYQNQLQSLQEHIADLQKRLSDASKLTSQKQEEIRILKEFITQQEQQFEILQNRSAGDQERSTTESTSCRRRSSGDSSSTAETESSGEEDDEESTPPNGRSAGDGCSPSTSAAASQDNLRPELNGPVMATHLADSSEKCLPILMEHLEQVQSSINGCDDPDHAEAQQIILEMHQVLADRDAELQRLTEEKRFYQLELIHWERNLALQRVGLPLALVPDRLSNDSDFNPWRARYSAPPVTKPRLPDSLQLSSAAAAFAGSRAASYELFSPSATSLSPDCGRQLFPNQHPSHLLPPDGDWVQTLATDERQMHWPAQQGSHYYYSDDDDDDSNNNGFTTPL